MPSDNARYFERRAYQERLAARESTNLFAMSRHTEMANRYALSANDERLKMVEAQDTARAQSGHRKAAARS